MTQTATQKSSSAKKKAKSSAVQFLVDKQALFSTLQSVQPICSKRTALEVTSNVFVQASQSELVLRATDLEISYQASFEIESTFKETVQFTVHARRLMELVKDLDGRLSFTWTGSQLAIASDKNTEAKITLATGPTDNFPPFPERIENLIDIDASFLRSSINQVDPLVPSSNANPALNGLLIQFDSGGLCLVATDGHSLARLKTAKYSLAEPQEWVIPKKAVSELKKALDLSAPERIFLGTCSGQLVFSGGNFNFFTRLIADKFPDYKPVLERKDFFAGQVDKGLFCSALRRANCLLAGKFISAKFSFQEGWFEVGLENKEIGTLKERIPTQGFEGQPISSSFYAPYVLTAVSQISQDKIQFMIKEGVSPLFFDFVDQELEATYLIMPVVSNDADSSS